MHRFTLIFIFFIQTIYAQPPRLMLPIGHNDVIKDFAFSKNGKFIVTGSEDRTVKVWEVNTGRLLQNFTNFNAKVQSVDFNPNNKTVIACSDDGFFYEWDIYTGKIITALKNENEMMSKCVFNPAGNIVALAYNYHYSDTCEIVLFDIVKKKIIKRIAAHKEKIHQLIFHPNGNAILSSSYDRWMKLWDVQSGKLINKTDATTKDSLYIYSMQFSKNGDKILVCNSNRKLFFYETNTFKVIKNYANDSINCSYAKFSNNEKYIVVGGSSGKFFMLDAKTLQVIKNFQTNDMNEKFSATDKVAFSNDDRRIFAVSGIMGYGKMYDVSEEKILYKLEGKATSFFSIKPSPKGVVFITSHNDNTAKIWNINSGKIVGSLRGHTSHLSAASFSNDVKYAVTTSLDGTIKIWDWGKATVIKTITLPKTGDYNVELSKDNKKVLVCSYADTCAYVYDVDKAELKFKLTGHTDYVLYATFSPDDKTIATASRDQTVKVWDANTGALLKNFEGHNMWVNSVRYSWNNRFLVSASYDSTVKVWDLETNKCYKTLKHDIDDINYADFGTQPKYIVTACKDKTVRIWDALQNKCLFTLSGHSDNVTYVEFDATGEKVLSISEDRTCKLWNAKTGKLIATFLSFGNNDYITLSEDGYYQCSPNTAKTLYYITPELQTISFDQLDLKYNRPDKILKLFNYKDTTLTNSYEKAYIKRIKKVGIDTAAFSNSYSVPVTIIKNINEINYEQKAPSIQLKISASDPNIILQKFNAWVNESPLFGMKGIDLSKRKKKSFDTVITIPLSANINNIEVSVVNINGIESYRNPLTLQYKPLSKIKTTTYFIGIGINQFKEEGHNLSWSVKDIRDLALKLKEKATDNFLIDTLFDENVLVKNILSIKEKLKKLTVNDKVILAYSGHGMLNKDFDYYLSTYNVNFNEPQQNGLLYDELESLFDGIAPRKKLMLIDACHSGEVDKEDMVMAEQSKKDLEAKGVRSVRLNVRPTKKAGSNNSFELMQNYFTNVSRSTGTTVISAAAGTQYALEQGNLKNGVFTYSVIEAMNKYETLTVQNLKKYVTARVVQLTNGLQKPNSRTETNVTDWNVW